MSNNTTPQTSTTTYVQPLQNPPYSPYYSDNSGVASNMGPGVNPVFGSGMSGVGPGIGSGGGGGAGGPGTSGNVQFNNQMPVDIPAIGGKIDRMGHPWTVGSLDPKDHNYHLGMNAKAYTVCCLCTQNQEQGNHKSISKGVENCTKLTPKSNLLLNSQTIWTGMLTNGFDSNVYVQDVQGTLINLFLQPDALSANEVDAYEEYLRMTC